MAVWQKVKEVDDVYELSNENLSNSNANSNVDRYRNASRNIRQKSLGEKPPNNKVSEPPANQKIRAQSDGQIMNNLTSNYEKMKLNSSIDNFTTARENYEPKIPSHIAPLNSKVTNIARDLKNFIESGDNGNGLRSPQETKSFEDFSSPLNAGINNIENIQCATHQSSKITNNGKFIL